MSNRSHGRVLRVAPSDVRKVFDFPIPPGPFSGYALDWSLKEKGAQPQD
ncbi:MAG TPA: hypothetical protein VF333_07365 [Pyrinomonadaceae bacterium]